MFLLFEGVAIRLLFASGPSINTRLLVAVLLSVAMLVLDQQTDRLAKVRSALSFMVYPILSAVNLPFEFLSNIKDSAITYVNLREENKTLKEQRFVSDAKLLKFAALEKENIRLRSLLQSAYKIGEQVLVAEILSVNLMPFDHVVLVNKGSRFGLHVKQPVLDAQGVVGQVVRTLPLTSEVMLITDPNHAIPVQINRNGLRTIAVGTGQLNRLILPFLPNNSDVQKGDLLITSGMGGIFPQGYPVAVVDNVAAQPHKPFALISATPKAALDKIREVLIAWSDSKSVPLNFNPSADSNPPAPESAATKTEDGKHKTDSLSPEPSPKKTTTPEEKNSTPNEGEKNTSNLEEVNPDITQHEPDSPSLHDSKIEDISTQSGTGVERVGDEE